MRKIFTLVALFLCSFAYAQTALNPGDIAFVGFHSTQGANGPERFAFVVMVDLEPGTIINFTDQPLQVNSGNGQWILCPQQPREGFITWECIESVPAGTVVIIQDPNTNSPFSYSPNISPFGANVSRTGAFNLDVNNPTAGNPTYGDQLFAFQGVPTLAIQVIAGVSSSAYDTDCDCADDQSCLGPLATAPSAFPTAVYFNEGDPFANPRNNAVYYGPIDGDKEVIRQALMDPLNWAIYENNNNSLADWTTAPWWSSAFVLPVVFKQDLVGFMKGSDAQLRWETAFEQNAKSFILERGTSPSNLRPIAEIPARNLTSGASYEYLDRSVPRGVVFYRLTAVDFDGTRAYSNIALVNNKGVLMLDIFPNPASNVLNIQVPNLDEGESGLIQIYNMSGVVVHREAIRAETIRTQVSVGQLPAGMYLVRYTSGATSYTARFVKQ